MPWRKQEATKHLVGGKSKFELNSRRDKAKVEMSSEI